MRRVTWLSVMLTMTSVVSAVAQSNQPKGTVAGIIGISQTWDDEGSLGKGAAAGGRVEWRLFGTTGIEASVDLLTHDRSAGFFQSEGKSAVAGASLLQRFGRGAAQPYVLAGVDLVRHSGTSQFDDRRIAADSTDPAFHFGFGLAARAGTRLEIGPEVRFYVIRADNDSSPAWAYYVGGRVGAGF